MNFTYQDRKAEPEQEVNGMSNLKAEIDDCILAQYAVLKEQGNVEGNIETLYRELRWEEPELAVYVKKKMISLAKGDSVPVNRQVD